MALQKQLNSRSYYRHMHLVAMCLTICFFLLLYTFVRIEEKKALTTEESVVKSYLYTHAEHLFPQETMGGDIFTNPNSKLGYGQMISTERPRLFHIMQHDLTPLKIKQKKFNFLKTDSVIFIAPQIQWLLEDFTSVNKQPKNITPIKYPIAITQDNQKIPFLFNVDSSARGNTVITIFTPESPHIWPRIRIVKPSKNNKLDECVVRHFLNQWKNFYAEIILDQTTLTIYWNEEGDDV